LTSGSVFFPAGPARDVGSYALCRPCGRAAAGCRPWEEARRNPWDLRGSGRSPQQPRARHFLNPPPSPPRSCPRAWPFRGLVSLSPGQRLWGERGRTGKTHRIRNGRGVTSPGLGRKRTNPGRRRSGRGRAPGPTGERRTGARPRPRRLTTHSEQNRPHAGPVTSTARSAGSDRGRRSGKKGGDVMPEAKSHRDLVRRSGRT